jgi:hypothetical protein
MRCALSNKHDIIIPKYKNSTLFAFTTTLEHVFRKNLRSGQVEVFPLDAEIATTHISIGGKDYKLKLTQESSRWRVYSIERSYSVKNLRSAKSVVSDLTSFKIGRTNVYFAAEGNKYYVPSTFIDRLEVKLALTKITPSLLPRIQYYARKYANDEGIHLTKSDLMTIIKIINDKTSEMDSLASVLSANTNSGYNDLLDLNIPISMPISQESFCKGAQATLDSIVSISSGGKISNPIVIKENLSTIKLGTLGEFLQTLKTNTENILSGNIKLKCDFSEVFHADYQRVIDDVKNGYRTASSGFNVLVSLAKEAMEIVSGDAYNNIINGDQLGSNDTVVNSANEPDGSANF